MRLCPTVGTDKPMLSIGRCSPLCLLKRGDSRRCKQHRCSFNVEITQRLSHVLNGTVVVHVRGRHASEGHTYIPASALKMASSTRMETIRMKNEGLSVKQIQSIQVARVEAELKQKGGLNQLHREAVTGRRILRESQISNVGRRQREKSLNPNGTTDWHALRLWATGHLKHTAA